MSQLLGIPVPSLEQIIVGTELVFILYIPRRVVNKLDNEFRKERNRIIHNHVKTGHLGRLKHCADSACASLRKPGFAQQAVDSQPELIELDLL
jgi:hypothetical protein